MTDYKATTIFSTGLFVRLMSKSMTLSLSLSMVLDQLTCLTIDYFLEQHVRLHHRLLNYGRRVKSDTSKFCNIQRISTPKKKKKRKKRNENGNMIYLYY